MTAGPTHADRAPHPAVRVVPYEPGRAAHRAAYRALNLAWIQAHFAVEARDLRELDDPEGHILAHGGRILVAEEGTPGADGPGVLGTCALLREADGVFELAKMAVHERARGRGVGRALGRAAVDLARALGARRVELLSNTALAPAIGLYRALGFVEVPLPPSVFGRGVI